MEKAIWHFTMVFSQPIVDPLDRRVMNLTEPSPETDLVAHEVIGAAIEVHRILGPGFLESSYQGALVHELQLRGMRVREQVAFPLAYKGKTLVSGVVDLLVNNVLLVELKSVDRLVELHRAQVISYLRLARLQLGLIINFNVPLLKFGIRRVIFNERIGGGPEDDF